MKSFNLSSAFFGLIAALGLAAVASAQTTLFSDDFDGDAVNLNGTSPDIGSVNWVATATNFLANGSIGGTGAGTATLAFTPVSGVVYTLDASFTGITGDGNWIPFGFVNGQGTSDRVAQPNENRFLEGQTVGIAWMFARGDNSSNPNVAFLGNPALGGGNEGAADGADWTGGPTNGGDIDMRIVLDTTGGIGAWTATWYAKRPADSSYTEVRATATLLSEDITSVGFGKANTGVSGTIESFTLTTNASSSVSPLLTITPNAANPGNYDFEWTSRNGRIYNLVSSTDLSIAPDSWPVWEGNEDLPAAESGTNTLANVPGGGDLRRFFVVVERDAPPLLAEDFESLAGLPDGWSVSGNGAGTAWSVGTPDGTGTEPVAAANGTQSAGTNMNGNYTASAIASLITPAFTVPAEGATLKFSQYTDTEAASGGGDFGSIRLLNAADDTPLAGGDVSADIQGITEEWSSESLPLPEAANGLEVKIEFRFESDDDTLIFAGFYIDDVVVTAAP